MGGWVGGGGGGRRGGGDRCTNKAEGGEGKAEEVDWYELMRRWASRWWSMAGAARECTLTCTAKVSVFVLLYFVVVKQVNWEIRTHGTATTTNQLLVYEALS